MGDNEWAQMSSETLFILNYLSIVAQAIRELKIEYFFLFSFILLNKEEICDLNRLMDDQIHCCFTRYVSSYRPSDKSWLERVRTIRLRSEE